MTDYKGLRKSFKFCIPRRYNGIVASHQIDSQEIKQSNYAMSARTTTFQNQHQVEFGLKVHDIDIETLVVNAVRCQFCVYYGRENSVQVGEKRQRKQTTNFKYWDAPFRAELHRTHHITQHLVRWESYQKLSYTKKAAFFETDKVQFKHTLHAHLGQKVNSLLYNIDASIVDTIIGDMFFHPDQFGSGSQCDEIIQAKHNTQ